MEGFKRGASAEDRGIIPRAIEQVFAHIQRNASPRWVGRGWRRDSSCLYFLGAGMRGSANSTLRRRGRRFLFRTGNKRANPPPPPFVVLDFASDR